MKPQFALSLFIFRRDLRLEDNTGLIFALKHSKQVIPAFIFTPEQIEKNPFKSEHCLQFMTECLEELDDALKKKGGGLYFFEGSPEEIVARCVSKLGVDAVIVNQDYTPYSRQRDQKIEKVCTAHQVSFVSFHDALLHPPERTVKKDGTPYTMFTPYFRNASRLAVPLPEHNLRSNYFSGAIPFSKKKSFQRMLKNHRHPNLIGGRSEALKILKKLSCFEDYEHLRNFPAEEGSTHLSPYLKFTVCSPREVFAAIAHSLSSHHGLIRSLYWRDFFTGIAFFFPHIFQGAFRPEFDAIEWSYNKTVFQKWCEGRTGFPIVDAGMREMNATGFMHNRVRMIAASFLVKNLFIDWRWGEKYFAQTLIDYDPAVNNGNWQWVASTGCDAQPYFRVFNPWIQQKKFDAECVYIKQWVPELQDVSPAIIHGWQKQCNPEKYPSPIVDHEKTAKAAVHHFKKEKKGSLRKRRQGRRLEE